MMTSPYPTNLTMASDTSAPKLPAILTKTRERNFRKPPKFEVAMNKRFLYKPYTAMYGDALVELKHLELTELADKTRSKNKMEFDRGWRRINLSFRDHQYAMSGLHQEQSLVYQLMCKVQKDKRRIQRQVHKRREEEFRKKMKWERIRDMCRYVVFKFRENVEKKKLQRQSTVSVQPIVKKVKKGNTEPHQKKILSEIPKPTVTETGRKVSRPPVLEKILDSQEEPSATTENVSNIGSQPQANTGSKNDFSLQKSKSESNMLPQSSSQTLVRSEAYKNSENSFGIKNETIQSKEEHEKQEIMPQPRYQVKSKAIQVRKDKSSTPLTKQILIKNDVGEFKSEKEPSVISTVSDHLHGQPEDPQTTPCLPETLPINSEIVTITRTRRKGIIHRPDDLTEEISVNSDTVLESKTKDKSNSDAQSVCSSAYQEANRKHKEERESLVMILKKRKKAKAKRDLKNLNKESFVKYERTKSGFLKAFPGKRDTFTPPSHKDLYNRQKLLKQERDAIIQQRLKLHKFYDSVIELRDRVVVHEKPEEKVIETKDKELPVLEDTLSEMTNSIFNTVQSEQPEIENGKVSRYVRVYDKDLKDQQEVYGQRDRRMSSWNM